MRVAYTPDQEQLQRELRDYFDKLMTPERREALTRGEGDYGDGKAYRETVRQMGRDGWLGIGWPKEYGGQSRSFLDQLIFLDEAAIAGAPIPTLTLNSVRPTPKVFATHRSTPSPARVRMPPSTKTSAYRLPIASARRTTAGASSPIS